MGRRETRGDSQGGSMFKKAQMPVYGTLGIEICARTHAGDWEGGIVILDQCDHAWVGMMGGLDVSYFDAGLRAGLVDR